MALLERLEILINADGTKARSEFESIGRAADKDLGRAEDRVGKMSARLQSIGTGAAVGGALVVGGLGLLAKASDDADKQVLKLENSIKNSDQAFRNKGQALQDVAKGLQQVTAADADAVIGSQSLLVQFGLTERQVANLTPLVVDLSRKLGIDMDTAAKAVGKSVDGSATSLKKMGISVDEAAFKTDSFQATFDALNQTVGGFARVEGQTFSGQLEILKNNVGDLGEAVGTGAAGVLGGLAGQAASAAGALNELNPGLLTAAGGLATTAGLVATVGGGFAVAAGKALEFKDTLAPIGATGEREFTRVGKAAAAVGGILAGIGIAETFVQVGNQINDVDQKLAAGTDKFRGSLSGTNAELGDSFARLVEVEDQTLKLSQLWEGFGAEVQLGGFAAEIEDVQKAFDDALNSFGPDAAQRLVDNLKEQNSELDRNSDQYRTNATFIRESQKKIDERREATVEATVADKAATRAQDAAVKAEERRQVTIDSIKDSVEEYAKAISTLSRNYETNAKKASAFTDALEETTNSDGAAVAATTLSGAMRELQDGIGALPPQLDIAGLALGRYSDEAQAAVEDLESFGQSATGLLEQLIQSGADDATVTAMADQLRAQLIDALTKAKVPPENFDEYIGLAGLDEKQIRVALVFANKQEFLEEIRFALDIYQAELDAAPLTIKTRLQAKLDQGDLEGAKALIDTFTTVLSGNPVAIKAAFDTSPELIGPILADLQYALSTGDLDIPTNLSFPPPYKSAEDYVAGIISQVAAGKPMLPIAGNLDPARADVETYKGEVEGSEPPKLPVDVDTEPARAGAAELFNDIERLNPKMRVDIIADSFPIFGTKSGEPSFQAPFNEEPKDGKPFGQRPGGVADRPDGALDPPPGGGVYGPDGWEPYPRKMGGDVAPENLYQVNEMGRELFRPSTPGFVMNASDTDRLISGVEKLVAGTASGVTVHQQIMTADPVVAGSESARKMRDAQFLAGV